MPPKAPPKDAKKGGGAAAAAREVPPGLIDKLFPLWAAEHEQIRPQTDGKSSSLSWEPLPLEVPTPPPPPLHVW